MRWIALALVVANLGYFAWQSSHESPPPPPPAPAVSESTFVNRLLLLSEVDQSQLRARAPVAPEEPSEPEPVEVAVEESLPSAPPRVCYSVGPLEDAAEVSRMRAWLEQRDGLTKLRDDEVRELALYWVNFPPFPTRADAVARVEAMKTRGIGDIYIIPRGDQANAVSLGVYSHRASLERRLRELRGHGYAPEVVPRYRTKRAAWFDVSFPSTFTFRSDAFGESFPTAEMSPTPCRGLRIAGDQRVPYNSLGPRVAGTSPAPSPDAADSGEPAL